MAKRGAPKGNQNAKGNRGGRGGPMKYKRAFAEQAQKACEAGFTDAELAQLFGVCETTINAWKLKYVDFAAALKAGKNVADDRVERSLYHRAIGYEHPDVHVSNYQGAVTLTPLVKHYPPDTAAGIFWLKNRRKEQWRDKVDHELTGKDGGPIQTEDVSARDLIARRIAGIAARNGAGEDHPKPNGSAGGRA